MEIRNLSQFRKWRAEGKKMQTVFNVYKPERVGTIRVISKVQSNGIYLEGSWLKDKKANEYIFEGNVIHLIASIEDSNTRRWMQSEELKHQAEKVLKLRKTNLEENGAKFLDDKRFIEISYSLVD